MARPHPKLANPYQEKSFRFTPFATQIESRTLNAVWTIEPNKSGIFLVISFHSNYLELQSTLTGAYGSRTRSYIFPLRIKARFLPFYFVEEKLASFSSRILYSVLYRILNFSFCSLLVGGKPNVIDRRCPQSVNHPSAQTRYYDYRSNGNVHVANPSGSLRTTFGGDSGVKVNLVGHQVNRCQVNRITVSFGSPRNNGIIGQCEVNHSPRALTKVIALIYQTPPGAIM